MDTEHGEHREIARLIGDVRRAERERDEATARAERAEARVRELEAALARADHAASMACLSPPDGCDCAGCAFAAEMGGDRGE